MYVFPLISSKEYKNKFLLDKMLKNMNDYFKLPSTIHKYYSWAFVIFYCHVRLGWIWWSKPGLHIVTKVSTSSWKTSLSDWWWKQQGDLSLISMFSGFDGKFLWPNPNKPYPTTDRTISLLMMPHSITFTSSFLVVTHVLNSSEDTIDYGFGLFTSYFLHLRAYQ